MLDEKPLDTWIAQDEACLTLRVSVKTINNWCKAPGAPVDDGKRVVVRKSSRGAQGRRPIPVYHPDDIQTIKANRLQPVPISVLPAPLEAVGPPSSRVDILGLMDRVALLGESSRVHREKLFLSIPEAATVSGLAESHLRHLISDGKLPAHKRGRWIISRSALEQLELTQEPQGASVGVPRW